MNKSTLFLTSLTGSSLAIFSDIPIFLVFGGVFIVVMLELKKIEKKTFPIIRNLYGSVITGWGASFGVKHFYPSLMKGDIKIFSMLMTTLFAYGIVLYFVKNETLGKWASKYINRIFNHNNNENSSNN